MRNPWNAPTRRDGAPSRVRLWATGVGSLVAGVGLIGGLVVTLTGLIRADGPGAHAPLPVHTQLIALNRELDAARSEVAKLSGRIERMTSVARYSSLYSIPADLAGAIYDIALAEGIHPSLGFQLVKVESGFKPAARSTRGAIGYTQLRIKTARSYQAGLSEQELTDRDTNLRIGFRFLKDLLRQFDQDLHMALVAYNRGPTRVVEMLARGEDPANGYAEVVLRGVKKGS